MMSWIGKFNPLRSITNGASQPISNNPNPNPNPNLNPNVGQSSSILSTVKTPSNRTYQENLSRVGGGGGGGVGGGGASNGSGATIGGSKATRAKSLHPSNASHSRGGGF